jgi:hypothetical protein
MVLLIATPTILSALNRISASHRDDLELPAPASLSLDSPISHSQVIALARYFTQSSTSTSLSPAGLEKEDEIQSSGAASRQKEKQKEYTLDTLLRGTKLYIPPPAPRAEPVRTYLHTHIHRHKLEPLSIHASIHLILKTVNKFSILKYIKWKTDKRIPRPKSPPPTTR